TDEEAQDAVGAMVDGTLVYTDATPLLSRAALTGEVTASAGSNATTVTNASVIAKVLTAFSAGAGTVSAADSILSAFQKVVGNIALKLTANSPITGATKTKITYDANGLVTAGADIAASDLPTGIDAAKLSSGVVSNTELDYLNGVTSAIQTQIDAKVTGPGSAVSGNIAMFNGVSGKEIIDTGDNVISLGLAAQIQSGSTVTTISDPDMIGFRKNSDGIKRKIAWADMFAKILAAIFSDAEGNPADVGTTADGTSAYAARRDHVHGGGGGSVSVATDPIFDAKGDLPVGTAADTAAKLTVGANLQIIVADSTQTTGLRYATGLRELIQSATPSGTGVVTFSSIPGTYNSLEIEFVARSTEVATFSYVRVFFNNDKTAANYRYSMKYAYGTSTLTGEGGNDTKVAVIAASTADAGQCGRGKIVIPFYAETTFNKMASCINGCRRDAGTVGVMDISASSEWESTAAITRVDVDLVAGNYVSGTKINLYGVK